MLFDGIFEFFVYYLGFLLIVGLLGAKFSQKHKELSEFNEARFKKEIIGASSKIQGDMLGDSSKFNSEGTHSQRMVHKKSALRGLYKHCPCRKAVENGTMSTLCIYSSVAGFMLSLTNIALMGNYATQNFIVLALSMLCAWLGWVLKK